MTTVDRHAVFLVIADDDRKISTVQYLSYCTVDDSHCLTTVLYSIVLYCTVFHAYCIVLHIYVVQRYIIVLYCFVHHELAFVQTYGSKEMCCENLWQAWAA